MNSPSRPEAARMRGHATPPTLWEERYMYIERFSFRLKIRIGANVFSIIAGVRCVNSLPCPEAARMRGHAIPRHYGKSVTCISRDFHSDYGFGEEDICI